MHIQNNMPSPPPSQQNKSSFPNLKRFLTQLFQRTPKKDGVTLHKALSELNGTYKADAVQTEKSKAVGKRFSTFFSQFKHQKTVQTQAPNTQIKSGPPEPKTTPSIIASPTGEAPLIESQHTLKHEPVKTEDASPLQKSVSLEDLLTAEVRLSKEDIDSLYTDHVQETEVAAVSALMSQVDPLKGTESSSATGTLEISGQGVPPQNSQNALNDFTAAVLATANAKKSKASDTEIQTLASQETQLGRAYKESVQGLPLVEIFTTFEHAITTFQSQTDNKTAWQSLTNKLNNYMIDILLNRDNQQEVRDFLETLTDRGKLTAYLNMNQYNFTSHSGSSELGKQIKGRMETIEATRVRKNVDEFIQLSHSELEQKLNALSSMDLHQLEKDVNETSSKRQFSTQDRTKLLKAIDLQTTAQNIAKTCKHCLKEEAGALTFSTSGLPQQDMLVPLIRAGVQELMATQAKFPEASRSKQSEYTLTVTMVGDPHVPTIALSQTIDGVPLKVTVSTLPDGQNTVALSIPYSPLNPASDSRHTFLAGTFPGSYQGTSVSQFIQELGSSDTDSKQILEARLPHFLPHELADTRTQAEVLPRFVNTFLREPLRTEDLTASLVGAKLYKGKERFKVVGFDVQTKIAYCIPVTQEKDAKGNLTEVSDLTPVELDLTKIDKMQIRKNEMQQVEFLQKTLPKVASEQQLTDETAFADFLQQFPATLVQTFGESLRRMDLCLQELTTLDPADKTLKKIHAKILELNKNMEVIAALVDPEKESLSVAETFDFIKSSVVAAKSLKALNKLCEEYAETPGASGKIIAHFHAQTEPFYDNIVDTIKGVVAKRSIAERAIAKPFLSGL